MVINQFEIQLVHFIQYLPYNALVALELFSNIFHPESIPKIFVPILLYCGSRDNALNVLFNYLLADFLNGCLKPVLKSARPYWNDHSVIQLGKTCETSFGSPSGHVTAISCAIYALGYSSSPFSIFFIALSSLARVAIGAHYPSQTILGWIAGYSTAYLGSKIYKRSITSAATALLLLFLLTCAIYAVDSRSHNAFLLSIESCKDIDALMKTAPSKYHAAFYNLGIAISFIGWVKAGIITNRWIFPTSIRLIIYFLCMYSLLPILFSSLFPTVSIYRSFLKGFIETLIAFLLLDLKK